MAEPCPHIANCPMYGLLTLSGTLKAWQARYCTATFENCERYRLTVANRRVPINLMPNGAYLKTKHRPSK